MINKYDTNSAEAELIYETLQRHYPAEIKKIQMLAAQDMQQRGFVSKETDKLMNELMNRVVEDNKRLGRT
jgi:hypothetical protein